MDVLVQGPWCDAIVHRYQYCIVHDMISGLIGLVVSPRPRPGFTTMNTACITYLVHWLRKIVQFLRRGWLKDPDVQPVVLPPCAGWLLTVFWPVPRLRSEAELSKCPVKYSVLPSPSATSRKPCGPLLARGRDASNRSPRFHHDQL